MSNVIIENFLEIIITCLSTIITAVVLPFLVKYLNTKTNGETQKAILQDISETVATCVDYIEVRMVEQMKSDGTWNTKTQGIVLQESINLILENLSDRTLKTLDLYEDEIKSVIERHIEAYIFNKRQLKKQDLTGK